ncbi:MAG: branched-chain amino acid ABC transporter permease [Gaiellaceae bacterium]|nr:MAG: branched-chain amino acid ABC transporter permease [Gaiellaceae bacterium]
MFWQLLANGFVTGSVYAIAAIGVSLLYGLLRLVNFAHGDLMAFGAFVSYLANVTFGLPMVLSLPAGMAATAALALVSDLALWRPLRLRRAGFMSLFLASIGVALVLRQMILLLWGPQPRAYDVDPFKVYVIGDVRLSLAQVATILVASAAIVAIALFLARSTTGRVMRAMADDQALAQLSGIDVNRVILLTWVLAGLTAGLAGTLAALVQGSFDPNFGFQLLLPVFAAVVLGGIGSAYGALAGGLALGVATELSTWEGLAGGVEPAYKPVVAFGVLIVALLVRPQGLFGRARIV